MEKEVKKVKNLTLTEMKKKAKKLDEQSEHFIDIGGELFKIKIDKLFRKTKQYQLLDDMVEFFNESNQKMELLELATPYTTLLFIKHFTSIDVSDNIDEAIDMLHVLIDLDILNKILNSMPEEPVTEVYELISSTTERMRENLEETSEEAERLSHLVENPELKEMLQDGESRQTE